MSKLAISSAQLNAVVAAAGGPRQVEDIYPLSPLQQGLLFQCLFAPESTIYVSTTVWKLTGELDELALERACQFLVRRHAILRTAFVSDKLEVPLQLVLRKVDFPLQRHDCRALPPEAREARYAHVRSASHGAKFDPGRPPLMRFSLLRMAEEEWRFIWTGHHLLLDGWSTPLLLNELLACYLAFQRNEQPVLPPARQFRDYITWLQRQDIDAARTYWQERWGHFTGSASVGIERAVPEDGALAPSRHAELGCTVAIPLETLDTFSRKHKLTLNTLATGTLALLLAYYASSDDFVLGVTISCRPGDLVDAERRIGLYINTLPLRCLIGAQQDVLGFLRDVQIKHAELMSYQYSSLADVHKWTGQGPGANALFHSIVIFENYPYEMKHAVPFNQAVQVEMIDHIEFTHYGLTTTIARNRGLTLKLAYDEHRFRAADIRRLATHYELLLGEIVNFPQRPIVALTVLALAERAQLQQWNGEERVLPGDESVASLFHAAAARTPQAIALVFADRSWTYAELDASSSQLAEVLCARGVGHEVVVGLHLERSQHLVIALLAVLKCGGAYLPLDPEYPAQRLAFMLRESGARVLLTQRSLFDRRPDTDLPNIVIDDLQSDGGSPTAGLARPGTGPGYQEALAYLIYTSGSTGRPKGTMVTRRALLNVLLAFRAELAVAPADIVVALTPLSFDISALELLLPLICGARIVLLDRSTARDGYRLRDAIESHRPTIIQATPATWRMLFEAHYGPGDVKALCGGEALPRSLAQALSRSAARAWNVYGPTETTVWSTIHPLSPLDEAVRIGRPLCNTQLHVLDIHMRPLPTGVTGELYIAGAGVARGYRGRAALTAERFVPDPSHPGGRLYRTGDLVRWTHEGELEFAGRIDHQVKLRGYRIELAEIEAVLLEFPGVAQAVVLLREDEPGQQRLVAYVCWQSGSEGPVATLLAWLEERLPAYMLPATAVVLETLPLNRNGKIDRRALPAPAVPSVLPVAAPRTATQAALCGIWCQVLNVEQVGIHDDFFALGGDSLSAMRLMANIDQEFGVQLAVFSVFRAPTIIELAAVIDQGSTLTAGNSSEL